MIWGPTGPYVAERFLYKPSWLEWDFASETMGDLCRICLELFHAGEPASSQASNCKTRHMRCELRVGASCSLRG